MKVVILAGGLGTRLAEETAVRPKPMVEIGGRPILWHIMRIYAEAGFREFVIALGYKGEVIKDYFANFRARNSDLLVDLKRADVDVLRDRTPDWKVHLIDTGSATQTGGRILRLRDIIGDERFLATYGDGVARIDVNSLIRFHEEKRSVATLTAVRPPARFGTLMIDESGKVPNFREKPQVGEGWINGGYFVFEPQIFDYLKDDATVLEHELERISAQGELSAYALREFWQPMDTLREKELLEDLWSSGTAPWKIWKDS